MIMDLQSAPAPRRKFVADAFSILVRDHNYHLVFIQRRIDGKKFRAIVDVQIPADAASSLANSFQYAEVPPTIANSIEVLEEPPEQTITLAASFARSAAAGSNCCIDFYYTSPFAVRVVQQIQELHAEPEVRIVLSDFVYHGFVSALREILKLPSLTQDNSAKLVF